MAHGTARGWLRSATLALAAGVAVLAWPASAAAAPGVPDHVGVDVSHPQCGTDLPEDRAFTVVGVNGGLANLPNPCLAEQLEYAQGSQGTAGQPVTQLYLNTANPGQVVDLVDTWPSDGTTPYGECDGQNSDACSWQYGWDRARASVTRYFLPAALEAGIDLRPSQYVWWLDVETSNSWQDGSLEARARNLAALEGMTAYLDSWGAVVGLYSTHQQWGRIVGTVPDDSPLAGRRSWLAGAVTAEQAALSCALPPLVPRGPVALAQYVPGDLDLNLPCS
ncbi:hypothetical protein [Blastococcus sp. CCUG 61487]|uniref:hypothetical protein n=1 Tax=Blastococcus sp. CCUG 61487 TaxID=1840703 RepID=UPI0010C00843|nr:hypothetical protein [Blastococcus sp. CCUG 61487]TKJ19300.1 hypothetical protein A6V29_10305 [Blastococcus sp. CCUG 61487]